MKNKKGFTLIELMVVILIVGILAAVAVPMMRGRIEAAKWSEGSATAGTIRVAVRTYVAEKGSALVASDIEGAVSGNLAILGFQASDLTGTYFDASNFTVANVNTSTGLCDVQVSAGTGMTGSKTMTAAGVWQ